MPKEYASCWNAAHGDFNGVVTNSGRMTTGDGHVIANFERIDVYKRQVLGGFDNV